MKRAIAVSALAGILWIIFGDPALNNLLWNSVPWSFPVLKQLYFLLFTSPTFRLIFGTGVVAGLAFYITWVSSRERDTRGEDLNNSHSDNEGSLVS